RAKAARQCRTAHNWVTHLHSRSGSGSGLMVMQLESVSNDRQGFRRDGVGGSRRATPTALPVAQSYTCLRSMILCLVYCWSWWGSFTKYQRFLLVSKRVCHPLPALTGESGSELASPSSGGT
ncbi:hypothetical protein J6590_032226, partial [Homalodisca vitripennis]